jgi:glycosyltransferase involved in cell wall biosynthesis
MLRALDSLRPQFNQFEIIIIGHASTDRTAEIPAALPAEHPKIRAVPNSPNKGQGESILIGFRAARFQFAECLDDDAWRRRRGCDDARLCLSFRRWKLGIL